MKKERNSKAGKNGRFMPGVIIAAFLAAAATFFLLMSAEKSILSDYEKESVWMVKEEVQAGTEIGESNWSAYFAQVQINKNHVPKGAVREIQNLIGSRSVLAMTQGMILTESMFVNDKSYEEGLSEPVLVGCRLEDLYQAVNGTLRRGDYVDIYVANGEAKETYLLWEDVLVYEVFDGSGNRIASEDVSAGAARVNLLIEKRDAGQLWDEINHGTLQLVKICHEIIKEY